MDDGGGSFDGDKSYEMVENVSESEQSDETEPENLQKSVSRSRCAYSYFVFLFRYISYVKAYPEAIGIIE